MFGKNQTLPPVRAKGWDGYYWVQEVFPTIQGEGPWAGYTATFVRLAGCNLRCHFCDTDFESSRLELSAEQLARKVLQCMPAHRGPQRVVITGGEPFRQPLWPLVKGLRALAFRVQVETAGTLWEEIPNDMAPPLIVCSPKTATVVQGIRNYCRDYKYIVRAGEVDPVDGLPCVSTQEAGRPTTLFRPDRDDVTIWLQPCTEYHADGTVDQHRTNVNTELAASLCMKHGYRLSLQLHKILGMP